MLKMSKPTCCTCLGSDEPMVQIHDKHNEYIHPKCMGMWRKQKGFVECPICREKLSKDEVRKIFANYKLPWTMSLLSSEIYSCVHYGLVDELKKTVQNSDENIDLTTCDEYGRNLLHYACTGFGLLEMCEELLKLGCDIYCVDNDGFTPFHIAVKGLQFTFVEHLAKLYTHDKFFNMKTHYGVSIVDTILDVMSNCKMYKFDWGRYNRYCDVIDIINSKTDLSEKHVHVDRLLVEN
jgi:hypothetical protein